MRPAQQQQQQQRARARACSLVSSLPPSLSYPRLALPALTPRAPGYRYEGEWYQGRRHGTGSIFLTNGDSFTGAWKEGKMDGPVAYKFAEDSPWANPDL